MTTEFNQSAIFEAMAAHKAGNPLPNGFGYMYRLNDRGELYAYAICDTSKSYYGEWKDGIAPNGTALDTVNK